MGELKSLKVGVVGSGSWATAIVKMLSENLEAIHWCVRNKLVKEQLLEHQHNPNYLSSVEFNLDQLSITTDLNELARNCDWIFFAVPSIYLEGFLEGLEEDLSQKMIVSAIKGIIPNSLKLIREYFTDSFNVSPENFAVIGGPCHAEEVALERLSFLTIGGNNIKIAEKIADLLQSHYIKTTISDDVIGIEASAVLKNIYAIAAGIAHGLGYGDNFQAVLMSNAATEMESFLNHLSPKERKISDTVYLGDLLVTGYSYFSRNRMLGNMIGKGYTVQSAILEMSMVAEGYYATKAIFEYKSLNDLKTPIVSAVNKVLYKNKSAKKSFKLLIDKLS